MALNGSIASSNGKAPGAPTIGTATAGAGNATVAFTAPAYRGKGDSISNYTATSSPSGITGNSSTSPITVSGLATGTSYTFTVTATAISAGIIVTGPPSAASNSVTISSGATLRRCTSTQISFGCCQSTGECGALGAGATCSPADGVFFEEAC
jgi:hypothetical protein